jgi:hypothetical protein
MNKRVITILLLVCLLGSALAGIPFFGNKDKENRKKDRIDAKKAKDKRGGKPVKPAKKVDFSVEKTLEVEAAEILSDLD